MKHLTSPLVAISLALTTPSIGVTQVPAHVQPLPFSCATFPPNAGAAALMTRFGAEHVHTAPVPWGGAEGDANEGTVLIEKDPTAKDAIAQSVGVRAVSAIPLKPVAGAVAT